MVKVSMDFSDLDPDIQQMREVDSAQDMKVWAGVVQLYLEHEIRLPRSIARDICKKAGNADYSDIDTRHPQLCNC